MSTAPALAVEEVPDYIEPMYGWRVWCLEDALITSVTRAIYWPDRQPLKAQCFKVNRPEDFLVPRFSDHDAPQMDCNCGIYATQNIYKANQYVSHRVARRLKSPYRLLGIAALYGTLIEHKEGWRAQYAIPQLFCLVPPTHAHRFDVETTTYMWRRWEDEVQEIADAIQGRYGVTTIIAPRRGGFVDQTKYNAMISKLATIPLIRSVSISHAAQIMEYFGSKAPKYEHHCPICDDTIFGHHSPMAEDSWYSTWHAWTPKGVIKDTGI